MIFSRELALALAVQGVVAFPSVLEPRDDHVVEKTTCSTSEKCNERIDISDSILQLGGKNSAAQRASKNRNNCGFLTGPCNTFDAEKQLVSVTGEHAYHSPLPNQVRGPCPGLNAAANHGYLPRSGVQTILQTITGLGESYSMSVDLAGFLAAYAIAFDGDVVTGTWSLGGPSPLQTDLGGLLGTPQGISYSHNKYEGDSSIGRCDAFLNDGDAHSLSIQRFNYAFESGMDDNRYTLDKFSREFTRNAARSEKQNPYYFAALFSTTLVSPAAYNFVINFMSNHTEEEPAGYLDAYNFKKFFAVEGDYPNFKWMPGEERIPENWYKRPRSNPYTAAAGVFGDLGAQFLAYPNSFRFGGNTAGPNTYLGIDIANFTGGAFNIDNLFEGDNLACFFFQTQQQAVPDQLKGGVNDVAKAFNVINKGLQGAFGHLKCPQLSKYDNSVFDQYTGHKYSPKPGKGVPATC